MQKKCTYVLLILLGIAYGHVAYGAQTVSDTFAPVDSAVYYFAQSRRANGIDTALYLKGLDWVSQLDADAKAIAKIEGAAAVFKRHKHELLSVKIIEFLTLRVMASDSLDLAIAYGKKLIGAYDATRQPSLRSNALKAMLEMRIPLRKRSIPEAFDYYTGRIQHYLEVNDSSALAISYFCLGVTYRLTGLPDMTIYNLKKSISYMDKSRNSDGDHLNGLRGWMNNTSVLGQLYLEVGDYNAAIWHSQAAIEVRVHILKDYNVSFLNGNIAYAKLMKGEYQGIPALLDSAMELATQAHDYPSVVRTWEIRGQYFMALQQWDSAAFCFRREQALMQLYQLEHFSAAGSHTPGYFLARISMIQNRFAEARHFLEQELKWIGHIKKEMLKEQKLLIAVYHQLGDNKAADSTFMAYTDLQAELAAEERKNRSKSFEIEAKIQEAEDTISHLETEKRIATLTERFLLGIAALLFLVAAVVLNRFRVTRRQKAMIEREKQRSEALLLNILPSDVAEELKLHGKVGAKQYAQVTVMFTDFKGFSQISEKLSPVELVAEIDYCFQAFDRIISKYNVEKIKTIGDAYMCAGGIPMANQTHAEDTVKAAIEIQQFMEQHRRQQMAAGKEVFEIRIGIHTGPVVAGIVGSKKFAYDIWGDTVNIASRMESSGETGKINISGSTYALVKDVCSCVHRGKIQAKNKGEIDMYFVSCDTGAANHAPTQPMAHSAVER